MQQVFILGCHKSGTSLLRSLLDGAKDTFAIPIESHFFRLTGHWINYPLKRSFPKRMSLTQKVEVLKKWIAYTNNLIEAPGNKYADSSTKGVWDEEVFHSYLDSLLTSDTQPNQLDDAHLYEIYVKAMYAALKHKDLDKSVIVEKSVENLSIAPYIKSLFPQAKFIHIVRNPYANLVAMRKKNYKVPFPFLIRELLSIHDSFYHAKVNPYGIPDYLTITYEDLLQNTKIVMENVTDFLGMDFSEQLLSPTSLGESWLGNSTSNISFTKVSTEPLIRWKSAISGIEIALINQLFGTVISEFNYEVLTPRSIYIPAKREYPINYALNRLLYYYLRIWNRRIEKSVRIEISA